jgi:hypothetical protein
MLDFGLSSAKMSITNTRISGVKSFEECEPVWFEKRVYIYKRNRLNKKLK